MPQQPTRTPCADLIHTSIETIEQTDTQVIDLSHNKGMAPQPEHIEEPQIPVWVDTNTVIEDHFSTAYYCDEYLDTNYHLVIQDSIKENRITWRKPTLTLFNTTTHHVTTNIYKVEPKQEFGIGASVLAINNGPFSLGPSLFYSNRQYYYSADVYLYPNPGLSLRTGIKLWKK